MTPKITLLFVVLYGLGAPLASSNPAHPAALDAKLDAAVHNYELKANNVAICEGNVKRKSRRAGPPFPVLGSGGAFGLCISSPTRNPFDPQSLISHFTNSNGCGIL